MEIKLVPVATNCSFVGSYRLSLALEASFSVENVGNVLNKTKCSRQDDLMNPMDKPHACVKAERWFEPRLVLFFSMIFFFVVLAGGALFPFVKKN